METEPWDTKLDNGLNVTENRLYKAMKIMGLKPKPQFTISQMTVDFAFPEEKIVIEVEGEHHNNYEQKITDKKRFFVLQRLGWKVKSFRAATCYNKPRAVAYVIKNNVLC